MTSKEITSEKVKCFSYLFQREVIVHVTYLKIGEINTLKEQFDADILVRLKWREPELDNVPLEVTMKPDLNQPTVLTKERQRKSSVFRCLRVNKMSLLN